MRFNPFAFLFRQFGRRPCALCFDWYILNGVRGFPHAHHQIHDVIDGIEFGDALEFFPRFKFAQSTQHFHILTDGSRSLGEFPQTRQNHLRFVPDPENPDDTSGVLRDSERTAVEIVRSQIRFFDQQTERLMSQFKVFGGGKADQCFAGFGGTGPFQSRQMLYWHFLFFQLPAPGGFENQRNHFGTAFAEIVRRNMRSVIAVILHVESFRHQLVHIHSAGDAHGFPEQVQTSDITFDIPVIPVSASEENRVLFQIAAGNAPVKHVNEFRAGIDSGVRHQHHNDIPFSVACGGRFDAGVDRMFQHDFPCP